MIDFLSFSFRENKKEARKESRGGIINKLLKLIELARTKKEIQPIDAPPKSQKYILFTFPGNLEIAKEMQIPAKKKGIAIAK